MTAADFFEEDEPVEGVLAAFDAAAERGVTARHVCVPVTDEAGVVIACARVSPNLGEDGMRALRAVIAAARRFQEAQDAADPEAAAERARRQQESIARIRVRVRRLRGGG